MCGTVESPLSHLHSTVLYVLLSPSTLAENLRNGAMASKLAEDTRIDPRLKEVFGSMNVTAIGDVAGREDLLAEENTEAGKARAAAFAAMLNSFDNETIAPSAGLRIST